MFDVIEKVQECLKEGDSKKALNIVTKTPEKLLRRELYHSLRGDIFCHQFRFDLACAEYEKAIALTGNWSPPYNGLGNALVELGEYSKALAAFDMAVKLTPEQGEFAFNRGQLRLLLGDWSGAKADYEARLLSPTFKAHPDIARRPAWLGQDVVGQRILLYWEQGQGDTVQFVRYARWLEDQGASLIIEVQDALLRLLQQNFPKAQVIGGGDSLPEFDLRAALPSLPWIYGETPETVYAPCPYLVAPSGLGSMPSAKVEGYRIGLVWAGNPNHINDKQRSIPQDILLELTKLGTFNWYSLQVGASEKSSRALARAGVVDLTPDITDFTDTAAAIQALDLVITVDTSVAHLAGALGKPVWILLPFVPDWRWLLERSDSPWYQSARLFRQPKRGDWASVLKEVEQALADFHC